MRTSRLSNLATRAPTEFARIGEAGRRPATVRELVLLTLLIFSLLWLTQGREIAYVITDPGRGHVMTLREHGDRANRIRHAGVTKNRLAGLEALSAQT